MPPAQLTNTAYNEPTFHTSSESLPSGILSITYSSKMGGMHRMIMPRCAICGKSATAKGGECPHEGERLVQSVFQAQLRWMDTWSASIKDWVTNESVKHVTSMFETYRMHRLVGCRATARSLPYFNIYSQHHGNPPPSLVPPQALAQLRAQLTDLDTQLQAQIDDDWKACARMYPQVLDYFFTQINVSTPNVTGTQRPAYSPPRPSDFPTSPIDSNSPELMDTSVNGSLGSVPNQPLHPQQHQMVVEDTPLGEIPGGYYTQTGISAYKSHKSRRQSQGAYILPTGQHVPMNMPTTPASGYNLPPQVPTHRRSRRWSAAAVPEYSYQQQPSPADPFPPMGTSPHGYGGVALQQQHYPMGDMMNSAGGGGLPPQSTKNMVPKSGGRRPSLPSSHYYPPTPGSIPAPSTVAGSTKHSRHSSYYPQQPIMAGRQ